MEKETPSYYLQSEDEFSYVDILREQKKIAESKIKVLQLQISSYERQIFESTFKKVTWNDYERWLLENDKGYEQNPIVVRSMGTPCEYSFIASDKKLQIGAFYQNDRFPRGCDLWVDFNSKWEK